MISPFEKAHQDAVLAVRTFLPSLTGQQTAPPPPPHPMAKTDVVQEMLHAAALASHVESASANIALGRPVAPPTPPSPQEQFPPELDTIHIRAIAAAIEAHPETERGQLISEAHDNLTKFIAAHNGKVIVHGKVMIAHSPKDAQGLAARIVNEALDEHDQRKQAEAEAAMGMPAAGNEDQGKIAPSATSTDAPRSSGTRPQGDALPIGSTDPATGRVVTHSTDDLDAAQDIATASAPELEDRLQQVADAVPGVQVHGVRPKKDKDRAQRKTDADDKPVHTHSDLLAGRLTVDSPEAKDAAVAALKSSAPVIDEEDKFQQGDPDYGFRSHDLQVVLGDGSTSAEVQVVPKEVADVDEDTHQTYERGREAEADGDTETADQAKADNKAAHDEAMAKFNERNGDRSAKLRELLKQAGFDVTGDPVRIGGHSFLPIRDADEDA